jgi:hypothetical protein
MILQIKATKANGDIINIYPERDGDGVKRVIEQKLTLRVK